ncbi:MipA/OmpV family protein [Pelagerythrobacter sp.]|uniref:MipA/OmpV family protein n=1 Tax=Pelagerythrobacter sp. TaxID=2800702 RepID=UPI0035AF2085
MKRAFLVAGGAFAALVAYPAMAQEERDAPPPPPPADAPTVYDGDWISVGAGVGYGPSYEGSDDYVLFPAPLVMGQIGPVGISPRAGGVALDFIPSADGEVDFDFGVAARLRSNRASQIEDAVVEAAGELDRAVEVGPTAGVSFPGVLNPYDSLSFTTDVKWDVAGAHKGMTISPGVAYFTPLSRGMAAALSVSAEYGDDDYADYYYSVTPAQSAASATAGEGALPLYQADGGFNKVGATLLLAYDLDGDLTNGGLSLVGIGGYSSMLGDAKRTPYTSVRGDADQWFAGLGIGYTF